MRHLNWMHECRTTSDWFIRPTRSHGCVGPEKATLTIFCFLLTMWRLWALNRYFRSSLFIAEFDSKVCLNAKRSLHLERAHEVKINIHVKHSEVSLYF